MWESYFEKYIHSPHILIGVIFIDFSIKLQSNYVQAVLHIGYNVLEGDTSKLVLCMVD